MRATRPALLLAFTLLGLACGGLAEVDLPEDRDLPVAPVPAEVAPPVAEPAPAEAPAPSEKPEAPVPAKAATPEPAPAPPADEKGSAAADSKGSASASSDSKGSASSAADSKGSASASSDSKGDGTKGAAPAEPESKGSGTKGAAGGTPNVVVEGEGKVVLVAGGKRYPVPGTVPPGPYDIEVAFPGEKAVVVGTARVREGQTLTIRCKAAMGICRPG